MQSGENTTSDNSHLKISEKEIEKFKKFIRGHNQDIMKFNIQKKMKFLQKEKQN